MTRRRNDPNFIRPRLPENDPAAAVRRLKAMAPQVQIDKHGLVSMSGADFLAACDRHGSAEFANALAAVVSRSRRS